MIVLRMAEVRGVDIGRAVGGGCERADIGDHPLFRHGVVGAHPRYMADGGLFFATSEALEDRVRGLLDQDSSLEALVLDLEGVNFIDSQGSAKLTEILELVDGSGVTLRLARVKPNVRAVLEIDGFVDRLGVDHIHGNVQRAVRTQLESGASRR